MNIQGSVVVVTGANRGIGRAFVEQLLALGAKKVYAAARDISKLEDLKQSGAGRVTPIKLDLNDPKTIEAAASIAKDATLLINNAAVATPGSQLSAPLETIRNEFETNYFGTLQVIRAFTPVLTANGGGAIVNVLSVASLTSLPIIGAYSATKAAAHSLTQAVRAELAAKGVSVHGVYPGPVDTDMARGLDMPKATPADVAATALKEVEAGETYIFPDPMAKQMYEGWRQDHLAVEAQFADMSASLAL